MALSHTNAQAAGTSEAGGATIVRTRQAQEVSSPQEALQRLMPLIEELKQASGKDGPGGATWTRLQPVWIEAVQLLDRFGQFFGADSGPTGGTPASGYRPDG